MASDTFKLIKNRNRISSATLLRSLYEAYVDFINLIKDENYLKYMYVKALDGKRKMVKRALSSKSRLFKEFHSQTDLCKKRIKELENLKPEGYKPLTIRDRFKSAGHEAEYDSIYALLCTETHNDLVALESRHLQADDKCDCTVNFLKPLDSEKALTYVHLFTDIIMNSSLEVHHFLKSSGFDALKKRHSEYQALSNP